MTNKTSESELAEANFERFILDFSRENKLVSEIQRSKETIERINQESLAKTKQKVEETLQSNTKIKQKLKEIDDFSVQEEETLRKMKDLKFQGLEDLSTHETEYRAIYNETQKLIDSTQNNHKLANERLVELEKTLQNKQNTLFAFTFFTRINWKKNVEISQKSNSVLGYILRETGLPKPVSLSPEDLLNRPKSVWRHMIV